MMGFRGTGREAASGNRGRSLYAGNESCNRFVAIDKNAERGLDLPIDVPRVRTFKGLVSGPPL